MSLKTLPSRLDAVSGLNTTWTRLPFWTKVSVVAVASSSSVLITVFFNSYRRWKAMGPGGLPYSMKGHQESSGLRATRDLSEAERQASQMSFLKTPLPHRTGPQTRALSFAIPQRQNNADVNMDAELRRRYLAAFDSLQSTNSEVTEWKTSVLEKRGKALFLKPDLPLRGLVANNKREICHVHSSDCSAHVTLSFADAKEVITKGYGERHRLSGTKMLPLGYTMLYVPRSLEEVDILIDIFQAGIDYMSSG